MEDSQPALTDLSAARLAEAIDGNTFALFRGFGRLDGAEIDDSPTMLRYYTGIAHPFFNGVARARLTPRNAASEIAQTVQYFRERGKPMAWWIGPSTQPDDIGRYLEAAGLSLYILDSPGMALDLRLLPAELAPLPGVTIERVLDNAAAETWGNTLVSIYQMHDPARDSWVAAVKGLGLEPDSPFRAYTALLDGEPVATSLMCLGAGVAGIYAVGTSESARGKGIGTAITAVPLLEARVEGYRVATLQSSEMGFSVYQRMGFREYCKLSRYMLAFS